MIKVDVSSAVSKEQLAAIEPKVAAAHAVLESGKGAGNDFLGWLRLPVDYDKEEFARIQKAAKKIQSDSEALVVIGIGGSYLGARAVVELIQSPNYNLKKKGHGALVCMLISAAVFALVHLTNIAGQAAADVALQAGYSFVVGLVFAAVYLKNNSLLEIAFAHFMIDFTNRIFNEQAASASMAQIAVFAALLAGEAVWAIRMGKRIEGHSTPEVE